MTSGKLAIDLSEKNDRNNFDWNRCKLAAVYHISLSFFVSKVEVEVEINPRAMVRPARRRATARVLHCLLRSHGSVI